MDQINGEPTRDKGSDRVGKRKGSHIKLNCPMGKLS